MFKSCSYQCDYVFMLATDCGSLCCWYTPKHALVSKSGVLFVTSSLHCRYSCYVLFRVNVLNCPTRKCFLVPKDPISSRGMNTKYLLHVILFQPHKCPANTGNKIFNRNVSSSVKNVFVLKQRVYFKIVN